MPGNACESNGGSGSMENAPGNEKIKKRYHKTMIFIET